MGYTLTYVIWIVSEIISLGSKQGCVCVHNALSRFKWAWGLLYMIYCCIVCMQYKINFDIGRTCILLKHPFSLLSCATGFKSIEISMASPHTLL